MKVIFLDIDGVLNTIRHNGKMGKVGGHVLDTSRGTVHPYNFDCEAIQNLNHVTDTTGAKIVISSNWRYSFGTRSDLDVLRGYFKYCGVKGEIISRTPMPHEMDESLIVEAIPRGLEIQYWLDRNSRGNWTVDGFVIVDDNADMDHLMDKLVRTDPVCGITEKDAKSMIEQLNQPLT